MHFLSSNSLSSQVFSIIFMSSGVLPLTNMSKLLIMKFKVPE